MTYQSVRVDEGGGGEGRRDEAGRDLALAAVAFDTEAFDKLWYSPKTVSVEKIIPIFSGPLENPSLSKSPKPTSTVQQ